MAFFMTTIHQVTQAYELEDAEAAVGGAALLAEARSSFDRAQNNLKRSNKQQLDYSASKQQINVTVSRQQFDSAVMQQSEPMNSGSTKSSSFPRADVQSMQSEKGALLLGWKEQAQAAARHAAAVAARERATAEARAELQALIQERQVSVCGGATHPLKYSHPTFICICTTPFPPPTRILFMIIT